MPPGRTARWCERFTRNCPVATVIFPSDLQAYTDGEAEVAVSALNYRNLVAELCARFPALTEDAIRKRAVAIDGMVIHSPLLEAFHEDAELVFFSKIAGG